MLLLVTLLSLFTCLGLANNAYAIDVEPEFTRIKEKIEEIGWPLFYVNTNDTVLVYPNEWLFANNSFAKDVKNFGTLLSGNTIVNGKYTQDADGRLGIFVSDGESSVVVVKGSADIDGALETEVLSEPTSEGYLILAASEGVNGTFSEVRSSTDLLLGVIYDPTEVWLLVLGKGGRMTSLEKFAPRIAGNIKDVLFNATNAQYGQLTARLAAIRSGVNGVTLQGLSQEPMSQQYSKRTLSCGKQKIAQVTEELHWDFWASASGVFSRINNVGDLPSLNSITGYFSMGADYRINQVFNVGTYAGYQTSLARSSNGRLRNNGLKYGLYGTAQWNGFYLNGIVGGGANFFNVKRPVDFSNHDWKTQGNPFAGEVDSLLGAGYEHRWNSWTFGINNSIQYTYVGVSAFTQGGAETKGTNLNVKVDGQNPSSLVYTLGGNISYLWEIVPNYHILPTVGMYWQHEFLNRGQRIGARYANGIGGPYYFNSRSGTRNNAFGTVGITTQLGPRFGTFAYYTPQFGGKQIYSNAILLGANFNF